MQARQYVELFHLVFLDQLGRKTDKQAWALKGGCNLRFFFHSIRYSEDMDLDVAEIPVHVLADRVDAILASRSFRDALAVRRIGIEHVTAAKQTGTTQRWKIGLTTPAAALPLPTKIEFSRRGLVEGATFGSVSPELVREYELMPLMASHYDASAAAIQKLGALASRSVVQARDVFDLHVLLPHIPATATLRAPTALNLPKIEERALSITFGVFRSQVLSYLPAELQNRYDDAQTWDTLVLQTLEMLKRVLPCN